MKHQATGFRFLGAFLASLAAFIAVFLSLVTVIDPNRHFGGHVFPNIRVAARSDKIRLFEAWRAGGPVTGLVLGSSRSMIVPPRELDALTGRRFFNAAVYNAFPEDYLAMYRSLVKRGATPQLLLIGVDDDHLAENRPYDEEMEANYPFRSEVDESIRGPVGFLFHRIDHYKRSLSFIMVSNMISSVEVMMRHGESASSWAPDGERVIRRVIAQEGDGGNYAEILHAMTQLSPRRRGLLETLIREAKTGGARIIVFVTPYRPVRLAEIRGDPAAWQHHRMAVDYLKSLEPGYGIRVVDCTDETSFGGTPEEWYDGVHFTAVNGGRLARRVIRDGL